MFSCESTFNPHKNKLSGKRYNDNQKLSATHTHTLAHTHTHSHKPTGSKANSTLNQNLQYVAVEFTCK